MNRIGFKGSRDRGIRDQGPGERGKVKRKKPETRNRYYKLYMKN